MDIDSQAPAVLLVDDEAPLLRSLSLVLRRAGIASVLTESDPRQVSDRLAAEPIALVVLDITMPYLSGETLLAQIHQQYPELGVIMLTATDDPEVAEHCRQLGAMDYLLKPVTRDRLVAAVQQGLEKYSTSDASAPA